MLKNGIILQTDRITMPFYKNYNVLCCAVSVAERDAFDFYKEDLL